MKEVNQRMHNYLKLRKEGPPVIPCDICMGGMDSPWHLAFYIGTLEQVERNESPLAFVICASDAMQIVSLVDICSECMDVEGEDLTCDNCQKEFTRKSEMKEAVSA